MKIAYRLKDDTTFIGNVQKATLNTDNFGIEPTHGLFGSPEWWQQVASGELPVHTLRGVITERYMGSMGDWPEIKVRSDASEESRWTREVNRKEQDALYLPNQPIEIDYVLQRHRQKSSDHGAEVKQVIEIRVEPDTQAEASRNYARLRAKEIAQGVLSQPFSEVLEASCQLATLGYTVGVMNEEVHIVFVDACSEAARLRREKDPGDRKVLWQKYGEIAARWNERVCIACKRILDEPMRD